MEWVDQEWPQSLKMCLAKLWSMYQEENRGRLRDSVVNAEEYLKMRDKKRKMENELIFFKSDFAKMVLAKEEALSQLASAKQVLTELKAEVDKAVLDDLCRCQNWRISGRGSRNVRLGRMVTGGKGHEVLPRFGPSRWR